jgi:two-component system chemotaxis response regulator CheY
MEQTIMIVDDSPTVVKFVSFSLRNRGYNVLTASDGMEAMEKLAGRDEAIDLIITDLNMPNVDGYEFIETLRGSNAYRSTPIIILSSEREDKDKERGMKAGATSYLVKPFQSSVLLQEVTRILD